MRGKGPSRAWHVGTVLLLAVLTLAPSARAQPSPAPSAGPDCPQILGDSPETQSISPPVDPQCPGIAGTFLGGTQPDWAWDVAVDASGYAYLVGLTGSDEFPITPGAFDPNREDVEEFAADEGFLAKFDPLGALVYSTFLGGSSYDDASSVAVDGSGNAYVTGGTWSDNFPSTTTGRTPSPENAELFVAKFDPEGHLVYSTIIGGDGEDAGWGIAVDAEGYAYVTGYTMSTDFPTTSEGFAAAGSPWNVFVLKLNSEGSLVYSTLIGGSETETAEGIAVDGSGNAYVTGITESPDFPITVEGIAYGGEWDVFVSKLNPAGDTLAYSTLLGGGGWEAGKAIALDPSGNAYVTGWTDSGWWSSSGFPTTAGAFSRAIRGFGDAFVTKLDATGQIAYSTLLGGDETWNEGVTHTITPYDAAWGIAVDGQGQAIVVGETWSRDFPTTEGALDGSYNADRDAFVTKLDPEGASLVYSTFLGGAGPDPLIPYCDCKGDIALSVAITPTGNVTVVGGTTAPDFPVTEDAVNPTHGGDLDAFFVVMDLVPQPNRHPIAWFTLEQPPDRPDRIAVNASRTADAEDVTELLEVRWDWEGDGVWDTEWSTTKAAIHTYPAPGDYVVALEVRDTEGLMNRTEKKVHLDAPRVNALASARVVGTTPCSPDGTCPPPKPGVAPLTVAFDGSAWGGIPPFSFEWSFGDGGTSSEEDPIYTYEDPGTYTATLVVTDKWGTQGSAQVAITVLAPLATDISFLVGAQDVLTISFRATPLGGTPPYTYLWDFGDGSTSTLKTPTHTYAEPGTYLVTLTVTDAEGRTVTKTMEVRIIAPPPPPPPSLLLVYVAVSLAASGIAGAVLWFRRRSRMRAA